MLKFYFDMDGVLCNFNEKIQQLKLNPVKNVSSSELTAEEKLQRKLFWEAIGKIGISFWESLEPIEEVVEMLKYWKNSCIIDFNILTKVPINSAVHNFAINGKKNWLQLHFGSDFFTTINIIDKNKEKFCKTMNDILVDDREDNCIKWQRAGGTAILYKNPNQLNNAIISIMSWDKK